MQVEGIRIMVLDRGRVKVGRLSYHPQLAFHWLLTDARIIRQWGTTEGLEQIANDGPTNGTKLDRACDCIIPFRAVIEILEANETKWKPHLTESGIRENSPPMRARR